MKNILYGLVILSLLIVSCTADNIEEAESIENIDNNVSVKKSKKTARLTQNLTPENPANVYDAVGKLHNDILDIYLAGNYQYTTIAEINQQIEAIEAAGSDPMLLGSGTNQSSNLQEMQEIVNNPQSKLDTIISNSTMTNAAKISLSNFMSDVFIWENNPYEDIYQSIVSYELTVMSNILFNDEDKRIILTTTSIVRYSLYYAKEGPDEDWNSSVGHRVGGLSGAVDNSSIALRRSLVIGIMINSLATQ